MADHIRLQLKASDVSDDWKDAGSNSDSPELPVRIVDAAGLALAENQQTDALTDAELRAAPVPVSIPSFPLPAGASTSAAQATLEESINTRLGEVSASPAANTVLDRLKAILTELQLKSDLSETQPVSMASFPTDSRLATAVDATASGDTTIVSITNSPRLYYVSLSANGANSADVTVIVRIGASEKYKVSLKAGAIWARNIGAGRNYITGSAGDDIIVNLSAAQTVHVSVEYADI